MHSPSGRSTLRLRANTAAPQPKKKKKPCFFRLWNGLVGFCDSVVVRVTKLASSSPFPVLASGNLSFYPAATDEWETPTNKTLEPGGTIRTVSPGATSGTSSNSSCNDTPRDRQRGPLVCRLSEAESSDSRKQSGTGVRGPRPGPGAVSRTVCFPLRGRCSIMS